MRKLGRRGSWTPSSRCPGGLNAHCSGGQILFFVSLCGEQLHDGVTPRPRERLSARLQNFSVSLAAQRRGAARSQTCPRKVAAEARRHGADPHGDGLLSGRASRSLREAGELCPRGGAGRPATRRRCLRLPVDLNRDKVELLSRVCGAERRPVCSRVLHYTTSDKKKKIQSEKQFKPLPLRHNRTVIRCSLQKKKKNPVLRPHSE